MGEGRRMGQHTAHGAATPAARPLQRHRAHPRPPCPCQSLTHLSSQHVVWPHAPEAVASSAFHSFATTAIQRALSLRCALMLCSYM